MADGGTQEAQRFGIERRHRLIIHLIGGDLHHLVFERHAVTLRRDFEIRLLLGWSFCYILLSGCTALLIRRWPLPMLGSPDFLLDYWYVFFLKISCLLLIPFFIYWKLATVLVTLRHKA